MATPTPAQLAAQMSALIDKWNTYTVQLRDWLGGTVTGGPFNDGRYPLTDSAGNTFHVPCPAAEAARVDGLAGSAGSSVDDAIAAASASAASASAASTASAAALTYRDAAIAAKELALTYANTAGTHAANALAYSNAAQAEYIAAAASAAAASASEEAAEAAKVAAEVARVAAEDAAADAAASAAAAATFDPSTKVSKTGDTMTGALTAPYFAANSGTNSFLVVNSSVGGVFRGAGTSMELIGNSTTTFDRLTINTDRTLTYNGSQVYHAGNALMQTATNTDADTLTRPGEWAAYSVTGNNAPAQYTTVVNLHTRSTYGIQLGGYFGGASDLWFRTKLDTGGFNTWRKLWHDGNLDPVTRTTTQTVTGFKEFSGGGKYVVQNSQDGSTGRGIYMWSSSDTNWGIYMGTPGASKSLSGGAACAPIQGGTLHQIRFRVNNAANNGFIWENNSEACLMSLSGSGAGLHVAGPIKSYGSVGGYSFNDRTTGSEWVWYATGGAARVWVAGLGDRMAVTTDGVVSATSFSAGYASGAGNSVDCSNWFRSSGNTGWYNGTYLGGIYMSDSTWIRTYNGKGFLCDATLQGSRIEAAGGGLWQLSANSAAWIRQARTFVQSGDPGAQASDNDLWAW